MYSSSCISNFNGNYSRNTKLDKMKAALFILTIILIFMGIRSLNVLEDVGLAIFCLGLAMLCLWGAFIIDKVRNY